MDKFYFLFYFVICSSFPLISQSTQEYPAISDSSIDISKTQMDLIYEYAKLFPNRTELSISIIQEGNINYFGIKRSADTLQNIDNVHKVFEIGSISKVFTSTLLANMILENKLDLDDPVENHLDYPVNTNWKITFRHLSNHTSGLPRLPDNLDFLAVKDPRNPYQDYKYEDLKEYFSSEIRLNAEPGSKYDYSNLGAGFLACVLSEIAEADFETMLTDYIFKKYDMHHSTSLRDNIDGTLVPGLDPYGKDTPNWDLNVFSGAGGILSTVTDLSKFAMAHFDTTNLELKLTIQPTVSINEKMDMGLGWHIINPDSDSPLLWHNGGTGGYASSMVLDVVNQNGVIILSNVSGFGEHFGSITQLSFELIKSLYK